MGTSPENLADTSDDSNQSTSSERSFMYVSVAGEARIAIFRIDQETGDLSASGSVQVGGAPGSLAVDPTCKYLFASIRSTEQFASFRIDPQSGMLALIGTVDAGANAAYVATDNTGCFLLSASYSAGVVASHPIGENGKIGAEAVSRITTEKNAHSIVPDPSNRFVFVPHTGPNAVYQFRFDDHSGELKANDPPKLLTKPNTGPRHIWFHPTADFAYFDNEQGSSVSACKFDRERGRLQVLQTVSTLPADFTGNNTCADIEVAPSGRFVYASNRGHDSIAGFAINAETGRITSIGQFATEQTPRSFNIDPTGRFLYAAGQGNGKLAAFRIDAKSGKLQRFKTITIGPQPSWVQVVRMP